MLNWSEPVNPVIVPAESSVQEYGSVVLKVATPCCIVDGLTETSWIVNSVVGEPGVAVMLRLLPGALIVLYPVPTDPAAFMIEN